MKLLLDCLPCLLKQTLNAARKAGAAYELQAQLVKSAAIMLADCRPDVSAPELCRDIHAMVRSACRVCDPYAAEKEAEIKMAQELLPALIGLCPSQQDPLAHAVHIAAAGNLIDAAVYDHISAGMLAEELKLPFGIDQTAALREELENASLVLMIGDNAGEAVFDTAILRLLRGKKLVYAVRSQPVLNDVTMADAQAAGVGQYAQIVSSGCPAPGCLIDECTEEFRQLFYRADVVIAKGQGNFEALSQADRRVYLLLKAKCASIAGHLGVAAGSFVLTTSQSPAPES